MRGKSLEINKWRKDMYVENNYISIHLLKSWKYRFMSKMAYDWIYYDTKQDKLIRFF